MNRRLTRTAFAGALVTGLTALLASSAAASYHENLIREVHDGQGAASDYVMLQSYSSGQNLVAGKHIVTYDGGGGVLTDYTIPSTVSNAANQATILISATAATPGADFIAGTGATGLNVVNTGGTVCFTDSSITVGLDCVAYVGSNLAAMFPNPAPSPYGTPLALGSDLNDKSIVRRITSNCSTLLERADDTNSSAADFSIAAPIARPNAVTPTEAACPTPPATPAKKKCKKKKKHHSAESAKKKKCKKKKHH
jgi:hypothetical protein